MGVFNNKKQDKIVLARQHVQKAMVIIEKDKVEEGIAYKNRNYVRKAGKYLWNGVLIALDFNENGETFANPNQELQTLINIGHDTIHLSMCCDGNLSKAVCDAGFRIATEIINRCEQDSRHCEGAQRTKQSNLTRKGQCRLDCHAPATLRSRFARNDGQFKLDCFATLAMTRFTYGPLAVVASSQPEGSLTNGRYDLEL